MVLLCLTCGKNHESGFLNLKIMDIGCPTRPRLCYAVPGEQPTELVLSMYGSVVDLALPPLGPGW